MPITPSARARLFVFTGNDPAEGDPSAVTVQFNPTTLAYSITNTLRPPERNARATQFVAQATAKLEFELTFDSTHDGRDVRAETSRIKAFLVAGGHANPQAAAPPVVVFLWGSFRFKGFIESMRESLDFFSTEGVPLRSSVKLSMTAENSAAIFTEETFNASASGMDAADVELVTAPQGDTSALATRAGKPAAGRGIAAANGLESMRNSGSGLVAVASGGVQLKGAAAFSAGASAGAGFGAGAGAGFGAGAGAGFGAGAGAGFGASAGAGFGAGAGAGFGAGAGAGFGASAGAGFGAGFGASAGAGFGAGAGAGFGASAGAGFGAGTGLSTGALAGAAATFGGGASAGVSASAGAFAGLGTSKTTTFAGIDTSALQPRVTTNVVGNEFAVGGRAVTSTSSGLTANVGATARLRFD